MADKKKITQRYYRKKVELYLLIDKIKLWPSRRGVLHGIKSVNKIGEMAEIITHCNKQFKIYNSRHSRAARWRRNKWFSDICSECGIPSWKLEKYSATQFKRKYGSSLQKTADGEPDKAEFSG